MKTKRKAQNNAYSPILTSEYAGILEMSAERKIYYDEDADASILKDKTIAVIGYGNQGRAQALNMKDSGLKVIIGAIKDESADRALSDKFRVYSVEEATKQADVLFMLIPDEVQRKVYKTDVEKHLKRGKVLNFAHGYNIFYRFITPPPDVDVIMVAPRMIGEYVRKLYEAGSGFPALLAIHQDASGHAKPVALAVAKTIGATRVGVMESTFAEEVEIDLFGEQIGREMMTEIGFEVLVEEGYPPWMAALEFWGSGEHAETYKAMANYGLIKAEFETASRTCQYGSMTRGSTIITDEMKSEIKKRMKHRLRDIKNGVFAREWALEEQLGYPVFEKLKQEHLNPKHPINEAEDVMRKIFRQKPLV